MKTPQQTPPNVKDRNDRLKAALQANMARRKAQSRARDAVAKEQDTDQNTDQNTLGTQDPEQEQA